MRQNSKKPWWKDPSFLTMVFLLTLVTSLVLLVHGISGVIEGGITTFESVSYTHLTLPTIYSV